MPGIGAQGFLGIALEVTSGTYVAPTLYVPIMSESLQYQQATNFRRPIRQSADIVGAVAGDAHIEGDISMEAFEDVVALFLCAARATKVKTGSTPNFVYAFTGNANAVAATTLSITVIRNGIVFAYTGCTVGSFNFTVDNGTLMFNASIVGRDEATQSAPTPTWPTTQIPYGAGTYSIEIPTGSAVLDTDTFTFSVEDNATPQYRLNSTTRGAQFVSFGERTVQLSVERDFETKAEFASFKALTNNTVTVSASKGANNSITLLVPVAIRDTYEVGLSGQGDLIRAAVQFNGVLNTTGEAYKVTVKTQLDIT
jgi:hypothetical protein